MKVRSPPNVTVPPDVGLRLSNVAVSTINRQSQQA